MQHQACVRGGCHRPIPSMLRAACENVPLSATAERHATAGPEGAIGSLESSPAASLDGNGQTERERRLGIVVRLRVVVGWRGVVSRRVVVIGRCRLVIVVAALAVARIVAIVAVVVVPVPMLIVAVPVVPIPVVVFGL